MPLLIFVAAETGVCVPLPSKLTSASATIPAFTPRLPSRCLAMDYSVTVPFHPLSISYEVNRDRTGRSVMRSQKSNHHSTTSIKFFLASFYFKEYMGLGANKGTGICFYLPSLLPEIVSDISQEHTTSTFEVLMMTMDERQVKQETLGTGFCDSVIVHKTNYGAKACVPIKRFSLKT
jgi:hypothetical protein